MGIKKPGRDRNVPESDSDEDVSTIRKCPNCGSLMRVGTNQGVWYWSCIDEDCGFKERIG